MSEYFVHESSYVDENVKLDRVQKFGIFHTFKVEQLLVITAPLVKM